MEFLTQIAAVADTIIDPYLVVDADRTIIDFNRAFYSMLPRGVARGLKGKKIADVITFELDSPSDEPSDKASEKSTNCIVERCWQEGRHIRLDEIPGMIDRTKQKLTFILSAKPFFDDSGKPIAALIVHRNVTEEAQVQVKYQEMLDGAKREREQLLYTVQERTKRLLETSDKLIAAEQELLAFRRRRLV